MGNSFGIFGGKGALSIYLRLLDNGEVLHFCKLLSVGEMGRSYGKYLPKNGFWNQLVQKNGFWNQSVQMSGSISQSMSSIWTATYIPISHGPSLICYDDAYSVIGYNIFIKKCPSWALVNKKFYDIEDWGCVDDSEIVIGYSEVGKIFNDLYGVKNVEN